MARLWPGRNVLEPLTRTWADGSSGGNPSLQKVRINYKVVSHADELSKPLDTFNELRIRPKILTAMKESFPHVRRPTDVQAATIKSLIKGHDIMLQDTTGSGKSLALLLGLLSQKEDPITSIMLVPHRDLAYQLRDWATRLDAGRLVATLVKAPSLQNDIESIKRQPPHVLIGTPTAVVEVIDKDKLSALWLSSLRTLVLDEADALIDPPSNTASSEEWRKWNRHRPPGARILDAVFRAQKRARRRLQLVFASATLRSRSRAFLESEWKLGEKGRRFERIRASAPDADSGELSSGPAIRHIGVVVCHDGSFANICNTKAPNIEEPFSHLSQEDQMTLLTEAVAAAYASSEPSTLLVLPSEASVTKMVGALQRFGIAALPYEASLSLQSGLATLVVCTAATVRGVDLPGLRTVILWDTPDSTSGYLHAAGRVGRLGSNVGVCAVVTLATAGRSARDLKKLYDRQAIHPDQDFRMPEL